MHLPGCTQIKLLVKWLAARGQRVTTCRDPGSTPLGERVREILLHGGPELPIDRRAEMLLYMAARAQLVEQIIRPALAAGEVVVSDRFLLAMDVTKFLMEGMAAGQLMTHREERVKRLLSYLSDRLEEIFEEGEGSTAIGRHSGD